MLVPLFAEFARSGSVIRLPANWQSRDPKSVSSDPNLTSVFRPRFAGHDFSSLISMVGLHTVDFACCMYVHVSVYCMYICTELT